MSAWRRGGAAGLDEIRGRSTRAAPEAPRRRRLARASRYTARVHDDIARILLTADQIAARITDLARQIAGDLDRLGPSEGVVLVPVLTGSIIFVADLVRQLPLKLRIGVTTVSSYPGKSTESQGVSMVGDLPPGLAGRHVLVVDDVLDSGRTLGALRATIAAQGPATLRTCVLLRKQVPSALATPCDYVGFDIPDVFVVGYGLDYDDHYRNLPYVGVLRPEAM